MHFGSRIRPLSPKLNWTLCTIGFGCHGCHKKSDLYKIPWPVSAVYLETKISIIYKNHFRKLLKQLFSWLYRWYYIAYTDIKKPACILCKDLKQNKSKKCPVSVLVFGLGLRVKRLEIYYCQLKKNNKPRCYIVQLENFTVKKIIRDYLWDFVERFLFFLQIWVWFSCIPSFNLLLCLELVKKFTVMEGVVESNFSVQLWSKP